MFVFILHVSLALIEVQILSDDLFLSREYREIKLLEKLNRFTVSISGTDKEGIW